MPRKMRQETGKAWKNQDRDYEHEEERENSKANKSG